MNNIAESKDLETKVYEARCDKGNRPSCLGTG